MEENVGRLNLGASCKKKLPDKPERPLDSDCCGNGCVPCVLDIYDQELIIWEQECKQLLSTEDGEIAECAPSLSSTSYSKYRIIDIQDETGTTKLFKFYLEPKQVLGLNPGQHIIVRVKTDDGCTITRQFTPVGDANNEGEFSLLIRIYEKGRFTSQLHNWMIGQTVEVRGPFGSLKYTRNKYKKLYMLAAGTGIAPMSQVIESILNDADDETVVRLLYSCCSYREILLRESISQWSRYWNFSVEYYLSKEEASCPSAPYRYGDKINFGRLNKQALIQEIPSLSDVFVLLCGTRTYDDDMLHILKELGLSDKQIHKF